MAKEQVTAKHQKFIGLLKELFQLNQPDLDFGFYRVMHAKSAEVTQFPDKDLLPQVKAAFSLYKTADQPFKGANLATGVEQASTAQSRWNKPELDKWFLSEQTMGESICPAGYPLCFQRFSTRSSKPVQFPLWPVGSWNDSSIRIA